MNQQIITKAMAKQRGIVAFAAVANTPDPYQDRLLKLIPAEVVAVYLGVFQVMKGQPPSKTVYWIVFVLLLLGNILYKRKAGVTSWVQLAIASVAYFLWVCSLGGPIPNWCIGSQSAQGLSAIFVPIFTLLAPLLYS